jgi:hypothetical protein
MLHMHLYSYYMIRLSIQVEGLYQIVRAIMPRGPYLVQSNFTSSTLGIFWLLQSSFNIVRGQSLGFRLALIVFYNLSWHIITKIEFEVDNLEIGNCQTNVSRLTTTH